MNVQQEQPPLRMRFLARQKAAANSGVEEM
jgi:hypothetical protein